MRTRPLRKLVTRDIGPVGRGEAGGNPRCRQVYGRMSRERQMLSSSEPVGKTPALDGGLKKPASYRPRHPLAITGTIQ